MHSLSHHRRWRREAAWVDAERLRAAEAFWPFATALEAEEARVAAAADEEAGRAFEGLGR
jgi:hypothetical protein